MPIIKLPSFKAKIATQGVDLHLHLPRRLHEQIAELGLKIGKHKFTILVEDV